MSKRIDLLNGSIISPLTRLALPIMGTSLIQMAYNMVDMIWIGRIGAGAVAAVGAAGMFMWLSGGLMILARMGGQVYTAQKLGAGDVEGAARYTQASLQMGTVLSLLYTLVLVLFASPLIAFFKLNSPDVVRDAVTYLWIVGLGMFSSFINQILTALITTTGNSRTPFLAMATGLIFNMVLDPLLIFGVGPFPAMGVAGAAIATVLAQVIVTVLFWLYARKDDHLFVHVHLLRRPDFTIWKEIFKLSIPTALQSSLFPMISMLIARIIAGFGDDAVAVQKVGSQIESISWMMSDGFSVAVNSFVAQNYGAGNYHRAKHGYHISMRIATGWGILCTLVLIFLGGPIFQIFIPDPAILPMGIDYLTILGLCQMFMCWEIITAGAYSGFGHTLTPSLVSIIFTALRIPGAIALSATPLGLNGIWWSISLSSVIKGILLVILFFLFIRKKDARLRAEGIPV
ncbi:MAG: MATE family efflux transporter [Candidatus Merdivicinus sp.]|jgi:putative MATE family efflux protein